MNIYIITMTWNNNEDIARCIQALVANTYISVQLVNVENGSRPEERAEIERTLFNLSGSIRLVQYIRNEKNLGIPTAWNQALDWIASQDGEYGVVLLDCDTEPQAGWLEAMLQFVADTPDVGLVGGAHSPGGPSMPVYLTQNGRWYQHEGMGGEVYQGECIDLAGVYVVSELLKRGLCFDDQNYLMYDGTDQDMAFRVRSWGYNIYQIPQADIIHYGSGSLKKANYQWENGGRSEWDELRHRNVTRFAQIWQPFLAPQRISIEAEMEHVKCMNTKLIAEAGYRKEIPKQRR